MSAVNMNDKSGSGEGDGITDSPSFTDGDFELLSSDNVRFRIPLYRLQAAR